MAVASCGLGIDSALFFVVSIFLYLKEKEHSPICFVHVNHMVRCRSKCIQLGGYIWALVLRLCVSELRLVVVPLVQRPVKKNVFKNKSIS